MTLRFVLVPLALAVLHGCTCAAGATCTDRQDCVDPAKPYCEPALGVCVECISDDMCQDGFVCTPAGVCEAGCRTETGGCSLGLVCVAGIGCVECETDIQCGAGRVCAQNACVTGCSASNTACPSGLVCDVNAGRCVGCVDHGDCTTPPRLLCDPAAQTCVECLANADCRDPSKPVCDVASHTCVRCVADPDCPAGNVCRNSACVPGCTANQPCPMGQACGSNGQCVQCASDSQCGVGGSCCSESCTNLQADRNNCGACGTVCATGSECCAGQCKPLNTLTHCGACGNACGADQFCDGTTCRNQTFPEFCANKSVYAIGDGVALDDAATNTLASTILQYCSTQTTLQYGSQTNPAWVDQTTGALLLGGGSTVVTAGGPFPNKVVKWLERTNQTTKIYFATNAIDTYYFRLRADDSEITSRLASWCNPNRDVFVVQLATDPTSATLALISYGLCSPGNGTQTGAWYWANVVLPNRASYPDSWYLYEWNDTNLNSLPDLTDSFTQIASGR